MRNSILITIVLSSIALTSCRWEGVRMASIMEKAGANRMELQFFLDHYRDDKQKNEAAKFLLLNMENKSTISILFKGSSNVDTKWNPYQQGVTVKNISSILDSLKMIVMDTLLFDVNHITSNLLIQNHELAFDMRKTKPWSKHYPFDLFCEFILPYRIGNEELNTSWRQYFQRRYLPIIDTMSGNTSVNRIFQVVKSDLQSWYHYDADAIILKPTQSLEESLCYQKGGCTDIANLYLYALRAIGVAATIDYIPLWGRTNYGHCELVYWDENNEAQRLKTGELLQTSPPKVYRSYFSNQKMQVKDKAMINNMPAYLQEQGYRDVTSEYTSTATIKIKPFRRPFNGILYLCVLNAGHWRPIAWSLKFDKNTGEYIFNDIGRNIAYLPTEFKLHENIPLGYPLTVDKDGRISEHNIGSEFISTLTLPIQDLNSELLYWNHGWNLVSKRVIFKDSIVYYNIPSNTLYRQVNLSSTKRGLLFTYNGDITDW